MPPIKPRFLDVFDSMLQTKALNGWRATIDNATQDVQCARYLDESDNILTEEDLEKLKASKPHMDGMEAISDAKAGKTLVRNQYI